MPDVIFPTGLPRWSGLDNTNYRWMLLLDTYVPSCITDINPNDISADELTDGSYARVTLSGATETISTSPCQVSYDATDPTFSALDGAEDVGWLVLFELVTNDADSILMAAYKLEHTTDASDFTPELSSNGLVIFRNANCAEGTIS